MPSIGQDTAHNPSAVWLWLSLIIALSFALRCYRLAYWGLWTDEGSIWYRSQDLAALLDWNHPPLFPLLFRYWDQVASSLFWWRLPPCPGTITVPLLYFLFQRTVGSRAALFAVLLLAVNPLHTGESQDLRMYTLLTLQFLVLLWAAVKVILQPQKPFLYAVLAAMALGMLYTQYVSVVFLVALLLAVLPYCWKNKVSLTALVLVLLSICRLCPLDTAAPSRCDSRWKRYQRGSLISAPGRHPGCLLGGAGADPESRPQPI